MKYCQELRDDEDLKQVQKTLDTEAGLAIKNRLAGLAQSCDLARIKDSLDGIRGATEMERRQAWDLISVISFLAVSSKSLSRTSLDVV